MKTQNKKVTISAEVNSPVDKVWERWNEPKHITQWNFATDDWCCPKAENNLQAGGKYLARMEAKDGGFGFDFEATYDEVKNQENISYTMPDGRQATTLFEPEGNKTKITTTFDAENVNSVEMQRDGWQAILNNFKKYTEEV
ncbi:SRPBCC family protein [Mesonia sp. K7]|uniref:SRPBCC family protein n=1 Tax=Mesonia sp. K7 TaxID=2218606 RepID=UPI000DA81895|nr:SRPBCC family protein [Mesonia sp. K7]PZD79341.1 activator of HSP90 ATPase [Mesonia sp. K7]